MSGLSFALALVLFLTGHFEASDSHDVTTQLLQSLINSEVKRLEGRIKVQSRSNWESLVLSVGHCPGYKAFLQSALSVIPRSLSAAIIEKCS